MDLGIRTFTRGGLNECPAIACGNIHTLYSILVQPWYIHNSIIVVQEPAMFANRDWPGETIERRLFVALRTRLSMAKMQWGAVPRRLWAAVTMFGKWKMTCSIWACSCSLTHSLLSSSGKGRIRNCSYIHAYSKWVAIRTNKNSIYDLWRHFVFAAVYFETDY